MTLDQKQPQQNGIFFFQLTGHKGCFKEGTRPDTILKRASGNEEKCLSLLQQDELAPFVPKLIRSLNHDDGERYLELQNLFANFSSCDDPNSLSVMDIKMGCRTYLEDELNTAMKEATLRHDMYEKMIQVDENEPTVEERQAKAVTKPRYMIWRETLSSTSRLGFRIEAMRLKDGTIDCDFKTTREDDQIITALNRFVSDQKLLSLYSKRLHTLKEAMLKSEFIATHELIGSSLLFAHNDNEANVWLIDFAKTCLLPAGIHIDHEKKWVLGNHEDGYLTGINNLIKLVDSLSPLARGTLADSESQSLDPRPNGLRLEVLEVSHTGSQRIELSTRKVGKNSSNVDNNHNDGSLKASHDSASGKQSERLIRVILEGVWSQNQVRRNSIIHLLNPKYDETTDSYIVNNFEGFLVIEPDSLLTCTFVSSSLYCERKTWLNHVFLGQAGTNRAMLVGTLVHEVFQYGVKNKISEINKLVQYLDTILDDAFVMLQTYSVELPLSEVRKEAISYITSIKEWITNYLLADRLYPLTNDSNMEVKIDAIQDIEENIWSTKYGLKGKIDVTGRVRVHDKRTKEIAEKIIPLELKTGNPNLSMTHAAQVSLYSMMIEDRYAETNQGFVIYLKDKAAMHNIVLRHSTKRDLVQRRNSINSYIKNYFLGPSILGQQRTCKGCDRITECVLTAELYSPHQLRESSGMAPMIPEAVGHLDASFKLFFRKHHERLISRLTMAPDMPSGDMLPAKPSASSSFWTYSSEEAESRGLGFGKLMACGLSNGQKSPGDFKFVTFKRHTKFAFNDSDESTQRSDSSSSSPKTKKIKISDFFKPNNDEQQSQTKVKPFDTTFDFNRSRIAISLDGDLRDLDHQNSSTAIAIGFMTNLQADQLTIKLYEGTLDVKNTNLVYRIDKIEKRSTNQDVERMVLVRLLAREDWRADRVRQLILDREFKPVENLKLNLHLLSSDFEEICELNAGHQEFVVEAASTDNYYILDEKVEQDRTKVDQIVSVLIRIINNISRSVLIVAQEVDQLIDLMNILHKKKVKFILIEDGKSTRAKYMFKSNIVKVPDSDKIPLDMKFSAFISRFETAQVVISSYSLSITALHFVHKTFNYCICYDCDKTELLLSLSPMFCSDRHIIIDVNQKADSTATAEGETLGEHLRFLRRPDATQRQAPRKPEVIELD